MATDGHELEPVEVAQGLARLDDGRADASSMLSLEDPVTSTLLYT